MSLKSRIFTLVFMVSATAQSQINPVPTVVPPTAIAPVKSFNFKDRMEWAATTSVHPRRFAGYVISSGLGTLMNNPQEYEPHWDGWAKRVGLRASTGTSGRFLEAGIGTLWHENPRYLRASGKPIRSRLKSIVQQTFMTYNDEARLVPAYARYIAIPANSYLTNAWRPDSTTDTIHTLRRVQLSFLDRMIGNAFSEFGPDLLRLTHLRKEKNNSKGDTTMKTAVALLAVMPVWAADDARLGGFKKHLNDYVELRKQVIGRLDPIAKKATPEQISRYRTNLADGIRMARAGTQPGNVFDASASAYFAEVLKNYFRGAANENAREVARQGNPAREPGVPPSAEPVIRVNAIYPQDAPKSSVPAPLLQVLPPLPDSIVYGFVGQTLILLDTSSSNIIIDYLKGAAPAL